MNSQPELELEKQNKLLKIIIVILLGLFVLTSITAGYVIAQKYKENENKLNQKTNSTPTPTLNSTSNTRTQESYQEDTNIKNQKKYISPKLGISFLYLSKIPGTDETMHILEDNNKIYIYSNRQSSYKEGQSLEVFKKDPTESLVEAIKKQFLNGKDPNLCFVDNERSNISYKGMPSSYEIAEISFPDDKDFDLESMWNKTKYCSADYAKTNGLRLFLADKEHPEKYIFLNIGQYGIQADNEKLWQDTIVFID